MSERTRSDRLVRLRQARLYLVLGDRPGAGPLRDVVAAALRGGVDLVQLRMKDARDDDIRAAAGVVRAECERTGALFALNDRPDLAAELGADVVHVGQDDAPVAEARRVAGEDVLVGVSTHAPADLDGARRDRADYAGVGPVHATPTKPGRPGVGLEYVRHAAGHAGVLPWFAIGGIDTTNVADVAAVGAARIVVVRAIADAADTAAAESAARVLRAAVERVPLATPMRAEARDG